MNDVRCTFPVGAAADPCGRRAVARYIVLGEDYLRCKRHDTASVRQVAEDRGYLRVTIAGVA